MITAIKMKSLSTTGYTKWTFYDFMSVCVCVYVCVCV